VLPLELVARRPPNSGHENSDTTDYEHTGQRTPEGFEEMTDQTVLCAGHVNWDVTLSVDRFPDPDGEAKILDHHQSGGGSASNTACVLAGLGTNAVLLGSIGNDRYGAFVRHDLQSVGVDCTYLQTTTTHSTTVKYILVDESGQVAVLANDGANEVFDHTTMPDATLRDADHLHLTSQEPATARRLAERATDAGLAVSFDPGRRLDAREYEAVYRLSDVLFVNETEATAIQESNSLDTFEGTLLVKQGDCGATACAETETISHDGFSVEPIDTTGAGDAFAAGFLTARLDGASLETALAVGNACGALATKTTGAQTDLSWADIETLLDIEE
jgi:ribokinase